MTEKRKLHIYAKGPRFEILNIGDAYYADYPEQPEDCEIGNELAYTIGGLNLSPYSAAEEWTRVAKALRVHKLKIVEDR